MSDLLKSVDKKSEENIGKYLDRDIDDVMRNLCVVYNAVPLSVFLFVQMLLSAETKLSENVDVPLNYQTPTFKWGVD